MTEAVQIYNLESFLSVFAAWERETRSEQTKMQDSDDHGLWIPLMSSRKDETAVWYWTFAKRSVWDSNSNFFLWYKQTASTQLPGSVHYQLLPARPGIGLEWKHPRRRAGRRRSGTSPPPPTVGTISVQTAGPDRRRGMPRIHRAWDHFKILSNSNKNALRGCDADLKLLNHRNILCADDQIESQNKLYSWYVEQTEFKIAIWLS